jgi:hypothetical protein
MRRLGFEQARKFSFERAAQQMLDLLVSLAPRRSL